MLKQAFDRYKAFTLDHRLIDKKINQAENLEQTFYLRRLRAKFEAFQVNCEQMKKIRKYWYRILLRYDINIKRN